MRVSVYFELLCVLQREPQIFATLCTQALLLLAVFTVIALINVSCAPLVSHLLVIMEFMSLGTLSLTITLSLYFTIDDGLNPAAEVG